MIKHTPKQRDGRGQRGEAHHNAKLTDAHVVDIRERVAAGETQVSMAREFGVSTHTIRNIIRRVAWKHIEPQELDND